MAIDLSSLTDYAWSDIAKAAKHAMVQAAVGGNMLSINGRSIGRISIDEAKKLYELAIQMQADEASDTSGGIALIQYEERSP